MSHNKKWLRNTLCALTIASSATISTANAEQIAMESASSTSVLGMIPQAMASHWSKQGVDVQLSLNQTLTKSLLKVAQGKLDTAVVPPLAFNAMKKGKGPYKKLGEKVMSMTGNVRSLFGMPGSIYHPITRADSGIMKFEDGVGKRVYIGPPAGAANTQIMTLAAAGGLEKGTYEGVKAPWGSASQNYQDGQFDIYIGVYSLGSQALSELSLAHEIRLLTIPEGTEPPAGLGMQIAEVPPNTYPGQVNEETIYTWQTLMMMTARADLPEETAYQLTKTYFEKRAELAASSAVFTQLPTTDHFAGVNAPLHPGAIRYYNEAGITIPSELLPQ